MNPPVKLSGILRFKNILLLAILIRAAIPLTAILITGDKLVFHSPDTVSYVQPARSLLENGSFSNAESPEIQRTPGYPLLLIPGLALDQLETVTLTLQIFLNCLTVYLVWQIARLLFQSELAASISALLYAVEPLSIVYTSKLLSETLFTTAIMGFLWIFLKYLRQPGWSCLVLAAIVLASTVYIRPVSTYLPLLVTLMILSKAWMAKSNKKVFVQHAAVFFMISAILIGAWQVRNKQLTGYSGFSSIVDINLYFYFGSAIIAEKEGRSFYSVIDERRAFLKENNYLPGVPETRDLNSINQLAFMRQKGMEMIVENPATFLKVYFKGLIRNVAEPCTVAFLQLYHLYRTVTDLEKEGGLRYKSLLSEGHFFPAVFSFMQERPWIFWGNLIFFGWLVVYWIFALVGIVDRNGFNASIVFLLIVGIYLIVISAGPNSESRFRAPSMPIICIFAGWGIFKILEKFKRRLSGTVA